MGLSVPDQGHWLLSRIPAQNLASCGWIKGPRVLQSLLGSRRCDGWGGEVRAGGKEGESEWPCQDTRIFFDRRVTTYTVRRMTRHVLLDLNLGSNTGFHDRCCIDFASTSKTNVLIPYLKITGRIAIFYSALNKISNLCIIKTTKWETFL